MSKKKRSSLKNLRGKHKTQPKTSPLNIHSFLYRQFSRLKHTIETEIKKENTPQKSRRFKQHLQYQKPVFKSSKIPDITLNDFANSPVVKTRTKKSNSDLPITLDTETIEEEDNVTPTRKNPKKKPLKSDTTQLDTGIEYPLDIWYILSTYIRPEDVGRFAAICKASNEVVHSATFWFATYKRHYKNTLPECLQPHNLRTYGLRSIVVRAIHELYPTYIEHRKLHDSANLHPVHHTQCVLCWYRFKSSYHIYAFKLLKRNAVRRRENQTNDVFANSEQDHIVFLILTQNLIPLPQVLGLTLTSTAFQSKYGTLDLCFTCGFSPIESASTIRIKFDRVVHFELLNWWHPNYPFNYSMKINRDDEDEE